MAQEKGHVVSHPFLLSTVILPVKLTIWVFFLRFVVVNTPPGAPRTGRAQD